MMKGKYTLFSVSGAGKPGGLAAGLSLHSRDHFRSFPPLIHSEDVASAKGHCVVGVIESRDNN